MASNRALNDLRDLIAPLEEGRELDAAAIAAAAAALLDEAVAADGKAAFLRALARKGESGGELAGFVEAFLQRAHDPGIDPAAMPGPLLDVCGTGGDKLDLFNVSTTAMFLLAAGGAVVVKHGNRSITSQCGGADVLEALGVKIDLPAPALREALQRVGCGFLFAPHYHPAFKTIAPVRKALAAEGVTTMFNLLGPLLNPARPAHQLVGIYAEAALARYAEVLQRLGRTRAWVVHGRASNGGGMDELSTMGPSQVHPVEQGQAATPFALDRAMLDHLGLPCATLDTLQGGNREENAAIVLGILEGSVRGPKRDVVLLNAAAGFVVAGLQPDLAAGLAHAEAQLDSGRALETLRRLQAL
jgi:anthranilate phosphoribosyltransferase